MIRIQTLGGLSVRGDDGQPLSGAAAQPRRMAVLALLARASDRGIARERMLSLLWPDAEEERARSNLAQALYALRRDLGADEAIGGTKELRLDPSHVSCDVGEFCAAITRGQDARAAELYAGPFLDGFHIPGSPEFERWCDDERHALAHDYTRVLESLARAAGARGDAAAAVAWWRKLAAVEPLNARVAVGLMEALAAAGDRGGALKHARIYEVLTQQELDLPPDRAVIALAEQLRREAEVAPALVAAAPAPVVPAVALSPASNSPREPPRVPPSAGLAPVELAPGENGRRAELGLQTSVPAALVAPAAPTETIATAAPPLESATPVADAAAVGAPADTTASRVRRPTAAAWYVGAAVVALVAAGAIFAARGREEDRLVAGQARRIAFDAALELDPALSPDGKFVAYASDAGGAMRLYVKQVGGTRAVPISDELAGYHRAPRWSPDGTHISFQSAGRIFVVPAFGGVARAVVKPEPPARWVASPAWSPDGRELAYSQDGVLYARLVDGGSARKLADSPIDPHSLAWSPDGQWIALVSGNATFVFGGGPWGSEINIGNTGPSSVWVVPSRGGSPVRVTDDRALNTSPVWLPGRQALLFVSDREGERDVYRVDLGADGRPLREPVRVTAGLGAHTIALSGDGRRMVYSVFGNSSNVWSLPINGRSPATLADARALTSGSQVVEGIDVSPDGRWLAFDSDRDGNQDIYKMPAEGGDPVQVTTDSADDYMPAWSPDGREIAFHSFDGGSRRVELVPADGGAAKPVAITPRNQRFPGWSPDGRAIVFTSDETGRMELYTARRRPDASWEPPRRLTTDGGFNGRWSPDGRLIAYTTPEGIWTIAAEGGTPRQLLRLDPAAGPSIDIVQWGRDGRTLYYKAFDSGGRSSIWSIPADGGARRLVVRFDDPQRPSSRPEFATDGRRLFFTMSERRSDIWSMELSTAKP